jgi:hypothetical protein
VDPSFEDAFVEELSGPGKKLRLYEDLSSTSKNVK